MFFILAQLQVQAQATAGYRIYDSRRKQEVGIADIVQAVQPREVLVFGEQHDDSIGHVLELEVLRALHKRFGKEVILSMEMFHRDVQYIIDEYLAGLISEKNFIKEARAWETYKTDYRPSVEFARENGLRVIAANTPSRYTNMVTRKGLRSLDALSREVRKRYIAPLPVDTLTGRYYDNFLKAMGGHTVPGMNLYQSQNLWDATMSWSVSQAMKAQKNAVVLMLNDRFHSDEHLGLVKRLEDDYKKKVTTISCFAAADLAQPDWSAYASLADFVILTEGRPEAGQEKGESAK